MNPQERAQKHLERLDQVMRGAEIKWGILFRLETLVPEELSAKFKVQWNKLSESIMNANHADTILLADGAVRGIWALEAAALAAGCVPEPLPTIGAASELKPMTEPYKAEAGAKPLPAEFWASGGDEINF